MPTYALLGATGATGSSILRSLLRSPPPDLHLKILVRSRSKLLTAFPGLEASPGLTIEIHEGPASSLPAMQACIRGAEAVFMCIAMGVARRGESLSQDTARVLVDALLALREEHREMRRRQPEAGRAADDRVTPSLLVLRAISLNPVFDEELPWYVHRLLWFALYHLYSDLKKGGDFYEEQARADPRLFEVVFLDPPAIHDPEGRAPPTGYELAVENKPLRDVVSYADLGEAFVEVARRRAEFAGKGVAVTGTGEVLLTWEVNQRLIWEGMKWRVLGWFGFS